MTSASKFIDFFIHDMLDFTIITNKENNFVPNCSVFNIRSAVNEILETLDDKIKLKTITTITKFIGFNEKDKSDKNEQQILVKTD